MRTRGVARPGKAGPGAAWQGTARFSTSTNQCGKARLGAAGPGGARQGKARFFHKHESMRQGRARQGQAGLGAAGHGGARQGFPQARINGLAGLGSAWLGGARQGKARFFHKHESTGQGSAGRGLAGRGLAGRGSARHGKARFCFLISRGLIMKRMKAAELVVDYTIYPRNNVDELNVRAIAEAIRAGATMPPVLADEKTLRIVDGVHRTLAVLRIDKAGMIDVIFKKYRNEGDMFLDAVRLNATHGARLDACDRTRCIHLAEKLSIPPEAVAGALNMTVDKLAELRSARTASSSGGLAIPLKRTIEHMVGRRLTKVQQEANTKLSGMNQSFYANQLITLIESNLLDTSDEHLMERLRVLAGLLDGVLGTKV